MRALPPVYSPLDATALRRAMFGPRGERALSGVFDRVRDEYGPLVTRLTDTGTSALRLALEAVAARGRRPIAMPAYNCFDLVSAARGAEVDLVYYDVDPSTLGPDMDSLAAAVASGASAVVVACLFGMPIEMTEIRAVCQEHGAVLIEDAAQGVGASVAGRPVGSHGDLSVLSFARGKGRTGGGGGALLSNTESGRNLLESLDAVDPAEGGPDLYLRLAAQWALSRPALYAIPLSLPFLHLGETRYREPRPVTGMSAASAAVLCATWDAASREADRRRERAERYRRALRDDDAVRAPEPPPGSVAGYLRFPLLADRGPAFAAAGRRLGVARGYPAVLAEVRPGPNDRTWGDLTGARELTERLWTLPTHSFVRPADLEGIVGLLGETR